MGAPQINPMHFGDELGRPLSLRRISLTTWIYRGKLELSPHVQEVEVFVEIDAENKTRCLRLETGDLESYKDLPSSDFRPLRTEIEGIEFMMYFCVIRLMPTNPPTYSHRNFDELLQTIKDSPPDRARAPFLQVLDLDDDHQNKRGLFTCCGDLLLKRFQQTNKIHDITNTIFAYELAFKLLPAGDPEYLIYTQDIAISYMLRCRLPGGDYASDLSQAISGYEMVVDGIPITHRGMPIWLNNLSILLENRYKRTRRPADLDKAIVVQRRDLGDLADALSALDEAIRLSPDTPAWLETKGMILLERFKKSRQLADIKQALRVCQKAVDLTSKGDSGLPQRPHLLGHSFDGRFEIQGNLDDIDEAIRLKHRGINLANRDHRNRARWLDSLAGSLLRRFPHTEDLEDLTQAISAQREAVEISLDPTHKSTLLSNLASSLVHRYIQAGDTADLNDAILTQHQAIQVVDTEPSHPGKLLLMNNLGIHLALRFQLTRVSTDIDDAIELHQNVVRLTTDEKDLAMQSRMDNLATALTNRYQYSNKSSDLEGAILAGRQAVKLARTNKAANLPSILSNHGLILLCRFERESHLEDVKEAIHDIREAISLAPDGHVSIRGYSLNLSNCLQRRFEHTKDINDINEAITILQDVVNLSNDSEMNTDMLCLWVTLHTLRRTTGPGNSHLPAPRCCDVSHRTSVRALKGHSPLGGPSKNLIDPQQTLDGLGMSIELCSQIAGLEQTIEERYINIVDTKNLIYHLQLQPSPLRMRALEIAGSRQTFSILNTTITEQISMQSQVNAHLKHSREWDRLLQKIREIPQFQGFLRPPRAADLLKGLPKTGYVVVINVFKERCDVLALVSGADAPQHIPLPDFSYELAEDLRQRLKRYLVVNGVRMRDGEEFELTRSARPMSDVLDDKLVSEILCILWVNVVEPILHSLGIPCRPAEPTRIWWCATGPLASLPLHAAGIYGKTNMAAPGSVISDFVISSYTPTLSALLDRVNNLRNIKEEQKGLLLVSQPKTPGLSRLPGTIKEARLVSEQLQLEDREQVSRVTCLDGDEATLERVVSEMESHSCIHFACHAKQDGEPLDSGFYLQDGRLELTEIIKRQFPIADLAFLSACQTSTGEDGLSEEAVHLAAGMLAAGYRGVVATMWSIKDRHGPVVAESFYRELRKHQTQTPNGGKPEGISSRGAATALHHGIKQLRESLDDSESSLLTWVPYVHIGS
ncbi:hypothetical protein M413DRAFT_10973 [Hebeloma cylindrosporum]|uniref:CHAT domain-containing protein n=1 Tax=Hebeloma cylindrosporum TaxID=76867 RepID=A0A0C3CAY4_HEBCY|nr:hypothetical protein M413DRAFT_10973 [Hebeloma cylindrosporum h7]